MELTTGGILPQILELLVVDFQMASHNTKNINAVAI